MKYYGKAISIYKEIIKNFKNITKYKEYMILIYLDLIELYILSDDHDEAFNTLEYIKDDVSGENMYIYDILNMSNNYFYGIHSNKTTSSIDDIIKGNKKCVGWFWGDIKKKIKKDRKQPQESKKDILKLLFFISEKEYEYDI